MVQYATWNTTHTCTRPVLPPPRKAAPIAANRRTHNMRYVSCQPKCSTWNNHIKPKMSTAPIPNVPTLELTFKAPIRNPRTYTPTEGPNAGKTYYTADAELLTPGSRWLSVRLKVSSKTPIVEGVQTLCLDQLDSKGSGVAHIVRES